VPATVLTRKFDVLLRSHHRQITSIDP